MLYVQNLVEEFTYVEAKSDPLVLRYAFRIFSFQEPAFRRISEFQLVTVISGLIGRYSRPDFRYFKMSQADQLVFDLLTFGFQLEMIGKRLPFAPSAYSEMLAERLEAIL